MAKQATLICCNLQEEKYRRIAGLVARFPVAVIRVSEGETGSSIQEILGGKKRTEAPAGAFADELLIMADFPDFMVNVLLQLLRSTPGTAVRLKAVATAENRTWPLTRLYREISREDQIMHGGK